MDSIDLDVFYNPAGYEWDEWDQLPENIDVLTPKEEAWTGDEMFGLRTSYVPITWLDVCKPLPVAVLSAATDDFAGLQEMARGNARKA